MHGSVLQNKKYIKFSEENTVEVMVMSQLDKGIEAGDKRAGTYKAKDEQGNEVEYLLEFPGLTVAELNAFGGTKAGTYNTTGRIPYTAIVNPHTLAEISNIPGGFAVGKLTDAVEEAKKTLNKEHGPSLSRKDLEKLEKQISEIREDTAEGNFVKAFGAMGKLEKSAAKEPEQVQAKVAGVKAEVVEAAGKKLDELEALIGRGEGKAAARELGSLARSLKGTDLEERANALLDSAKSG